MHNHPRSLYLVLFLVFLAACTLIIPDGPTAEHTPTGLSSQASLLLSPTQTLIPVANPEPAAPSPPAANPEPTTTPLPAVIPLDPANWKNWPVIPIVPLHAREIYLLGQTLGDDPHAFSVFGDCQSEPDVFMGIYETDPAALAALPQDLQQTVAWFSGSFNRLSPTVRGGTTAGALLWPEWHENKFTCTIYESPLQCELRIHKPSFVIIHVGTHYENRNEQYMRSILDQLIAAGVVPILATKADDRELDDHVNTQYAQLAVEYNVPFWNFWAAVDGLPNRGLYTRPDATYQGDLYLTDQAAAFHRLSALQALDMVWRAVTGTDTPQP
jgi:hypothetical protein